ncbi:MAG: methyltransferase domain-containing protein [Pseudomonadota bacterium]
MQPDDSNAPDPACVRRRFDRAAATFDDAAVLHDRVRAQLLERLELVDLDPRAVLDVGAGTGRALAPLRQRFRRAQLFAVDSSQAMLDRLPRTRLGFKPRRVTALRADAAALPFDDASVDVVFSNLCLPWCPDPDAVIGEFRRVLRPRGLLLFSALGPDTLREVRTAWDDDGAHVHRFFDMHDIGDALVRNGLGEPVLDVERYTLTYPDAAALFTDLRAVGGRNAAKGRPAGLTGVKRFDRFVTALNDGRRDGRLAVTVETVFGTRQCPALGIELG